ncbi:hypothetical protein TYRP_009120 [Tyrophagus putrescentiae]|nr:hypothetical protein TYRP_009120 [Tyrophagus putrescentiae]
MSSQLSGNGSGSGSNGNGTENVCPPYSIRRMAASELRQAIAIFAEHDLVEAPSTVASFYATDPGAFLVAVLNRGENKNEGDGDDEVIACIAAPMTTHRTRFLGLYACAPAYRGLDIGKCLFTACMELVVRGDNCGLASVPSKVKVYKHYCVRLDAGKLKQPDKGENCSQPEKTDKEEEEEEVSITEQVIAYDADVHLESRRQLMSLEIGQADTCTVAVINEKEKRLVGFGMAPSTLTAATLLSLLQIKIGENNFDQVVCLATTSSSGLNSIATSLLCLPEVERDEKLYRKAVPPFKYNLLYCCHTPSFAC